jgi:hypothetical protein
MTRNWTICLAAAVVVLGSRIASSQSPPYREVNLLDYGANGSDTVDDASQIQAAINAAGVGGAQP